MGVGYDMLFDARPPAIRGVFPAPRNAAKRPRVGAVNGRPGPIDLVGVVKFLQKHLVQGGPDAGLLPPLQTSPEVIPQPHPIS